jgi:hypothetical protein
MSDFIHPRATVYPAPNELSKAWGWLAWEGGGSFWDFWGSVAVKCATKYLKIEIYRPIFRSIFKQ